MNILIIEDSQPRSASTCLQLQALGHAVFPVYDLIAAQHQIETGTSRIQLVILDQDGFDAQAIAWILALKAQHPEIHYWVLASDLPEQERRALQMVGVAVHQKPLLFGPVLDRLRRRHAQRAPVLPFVDPALSRPAEGAA
jgi:DNA-binding response OmpR family regulator